MSFADDLARFRKKVDDRADTFTTYLVLAMAKSVVFKSPVGDPTLWKTPAPKGYVGGTFRASWQYGSDAVPGPVDFPPDKSGASAIKRIQQGMGQRPAGHVHYIVNNLPYARPLEYGWSRQAPQGMVGITMLEAHKYVKDALKAAQED